MQPQLCTAYVRLCEIPKAADGGMCVQSQLTSSRASATILTWLLGTARMSTGTPALWWLAVSFKAGDFSSCDMGPCFTANQCHSDTILGCSILLQQPATPTLHRAVCHLHQQERARGAVSNDSEFWVERGIQSVKEELRYCLMQKPEGLYTNTLLLDNALARMPRDQDSHVQTFDQLCPGYRAKPLTGPIFDAGDADGMQLLHKGRISSGVELLRLRQLAVGWLQRQPMAVEGLQSPQQRDSMQLYMHTQLHKQGEALIASLQHSRLRSRISYFVLLQLVGQDMQ